MIDARIVGIMSVLLAAVFIAAVPTVLGAEYDIIPKPQSITPVVGVFLLDGSTTIDSPADDRSREIAEYLRDAIRTQTGISISKNKTGNNRIEFRFDPNIVGDEAYRLTVSESRVVIEASDSKGHFWAVQTLRQILPSTRGEVVAIPAVVINDKPEYAYRGHMLDVGRHFFPVEFIKRQIDLLSYYKINTFRWHLTEDQGWRIEIKKYPKLIAVGAWRKEPDGSTYGGYYTQRQIREVVEYACVRNVQVIPEIEMPGHSVAALAAYPEYSCRQKPLKVTAEWGVHKDVFCAGNEHTFDFLKDVLDEVIELFPSPYIHIGGDEVPKDRWKECPLCQQRIRSENLKDEHELQSYFIRRIQQYLESKGKTLIGWDEILEGGADRNVVVEVWRGNAEAAKALAGGHRVIVAGPFYFDTPIKNKTLKEVFFTDLTSIPSYFENRDLVLGAECPLWTENVTPVNAESKLYPRLQAFAEVTWAGNGGSFDDLRRRMAAHYEYMDLLGIAYGPEDRALAEYGIARVPSIAAWRLTGVKGFKDIKFRYTTDGSEPSLRSRSFTDLLDVSRPALIKVAPFRNGRQVDLSKQFALTANAAIGGSVKYANPIDTRYAKAGEAALIDGIVGSRDYNDGIWVGWQGADMDAVIDLGSPRRFTSVSVNFLQQSNSWIVLPRRVSMFASEDKETWVELKTIDTGADAMDMDTSIRTITFKQPKSITARYVRVNAVRFGKLPAGHNGAGGESWIFADEIIVR